MILVDSNVIIDVLDRDPNWFEWSADQLTEAGSRNELLTNAVVVAELSRGFDRLADLMSNLTSFGFAARSLDEASAFLAGKRFQDYRRARASNDQLRVLPDFLIGAHAVMLNTPLLTRDPRLYRRYFPELPLITPETHP